MTSTPHRRHAPSSLVASALLLLLFVAGCGGAAGRGGEPPRAPASVDGWVRLDRSVVPRRYDLDLSVDPGQPGFHGKVAIEVELSRATREIAMHAQDLTLRSVQIVSGGTTHPARAVPGLHGGLLLVTDVTLPAGPARIEIAFAAPFSTVSHGLYRVEERGRWYAFTQFQPLSARRVFPSFDQPEFKTPYRVKLRVPREMMAVSSGPMVSRVTRGEERTFIFDETKPIPTYLLALAVGEFEAVPVPEDERPGPVLRILVPHGRADLADYAAHRTRGVLDYLVDWFGRPMPFAKLDQLAVPEFTFGAMENVGLVTYRESRLLVDPELTTARDRLWVDVTIAHEISHMWFGNLVTLPWWDDLWLNESFASWMQSKVVDALSPELEAGLEAAAHAQYVMYLDSKRDARAVRQPIRSGGDVYNAFDGITYGKGAALLRMVEAWIGEDALQQGVRAYLADHAYGSGGTPELLSALDRAAEAPVSRVVQSFIDRPGTPLVKVSLSCDPEGLWPATLALEQQRYLPAGRSDASEPWVFPVCVRWPAAGGNGHARSGDGRADRACFLMEEPRQEFPLPTAACPAWIHPNADEQGYYRWSIGESDLLALVRDHRERLTLRERLALAGNLRALLEAGDLSVEGYLEGLLAISEDPHRRTAEAIVPGLWSLWRIIEGEDVAPFAHFARLALGPHLERIGLVPRAGESRDATLLRSRLVPALADMGQHDGIRVRAREAADAFLDGDTLGFTSEELRVLVPIASWDGDLSHWQRLHAALLATDRPGRRRNLIAALGSFDDPTLAVKTLELVLDGTLRAEDWGAVSGTRPRARDGVFDWVTRHYDALVARLGELRAANLPWIAARFCSESRREQVEAFFRGLPPQPGRERNLALALEDVERCSAARDTLGEPMRAWLNGLPR